MTNEKDYINFKVNDFVDDKYFKDWVIRPDKTNRIYWETFRKENPQLKEIVNSAKQIVQALNFEEKPVDREEYQPSLNKLKEKLTDKMRRSVRINQIYRWWGNIAAVLVLSFMAISIYYFSEKQSSPSLENQIVQVIAPHGHKSNVILSDGTSVWLNSGSKLEYSFNSNSDERKVSLEGEAFFDVKKDIHRPFYVENKDYTVKVYGTRFNIRSYPEQQISETILEEGKISVITAAGNELVMKPGQQFLMGQNTKYRLNSVDPDMFLCWKDNILNVNNEELQHLIIKLERWYGVKIKVNNYDQAKHLRYTLTLKTESFRELLELMNFVTPFTYKINGEEVMLNYNTKL